VGLYPVRTDIFFEIARHRGLYYAKIGRIIEDEIGFR
jgi:hypothetical protein